MALFETHRTHAPATGFTGLFGALFTIYADWAERRATRTALLTLSDRELDDIGLTRGDIDRSI